MLPINKSLYCSNNERHRAHDTCPGVDSIRLIVLDEMKEHDEKYRTNGGIRCDVYKGPCACGAWH